MRDFFASALEVIKVAVVAVGVVFLIRTFLVQPFLVSGSSMIPNFRSGDYLLVDELTYRFRVPERGEVVVFESPNESTFFIKRIIGLPGESVEIKNGKIYILESDGEEQLISEESYLPPQVINGNSVTHLGDDEFFVLGDNRSYSLDSRSWGPLSSKKIIGLVRLRLWPIQSVQAFWAPEYPITQ